MKLMPKSKRIAKNDELNIDFIKGLKKIFKGNVKKIEASSLCSQL